MSKSTTNKNFDKVNLDWSTIQSELRTKLGKEVYESWIKKINLFEEFNMNTFQTGLRNIGLSIRYTLEEFDFGIGYRSPIGTNSFNNENSFEAFFRYNFDFLGFLSNVSSDELLR